jgi:hypothetical protein
MRKRFRRVPLAVSAVVVVADRALYARQRRMTDLAKLVWVVLGIIAVLVFLASQTYMGGS